MKNILFLLLLILVFSCKKDEKVNVNKTDHVENNQKHQNTKSSDSIKLQTFGFPQEVEGCSCYFAVDREQFVKQNYIYVDDFQKNAFLKINNEQVKIPYNKQNEVLPNKALNIKAENKSYNISLKGNVVKEGEIETALYKGILTVERKDGKKFETPVYGECGC